MSSFIKLTSPVLPIYQLAATVLYGAMIGDHVTPIDHMYIGVKSLRIASQNRSESDHVPVTAPADGVITELRSLGQPWLQIGGIWGNCHMGPKSEDRWIDNSRI